MPEPTVNQARESVYRVIVAAVDDSAPGRHGLATAARIARANEARVVVVHVRHLPPAAAEAVAVPAVETSLAEIGERIEGWAREDLKGLEWKMHQVGGPVGPAVLACARDEEADLIVIGSNPHSGLHNLLVGSTTVYLVDHSPIPILVARQPSAASAG